MTTTFCSCKTRSLCSCWPQVEEIKEWQRTDSYQNRAMKLNSKLKKESSSQFKNEIWKNNKFWNKIDCSSCITYPMEFFSKANTAVDQKFFQVSILFYRYDLQMFLTPRFVEVYRGPFLVQAQVQYLILI